MERSFDALWWKPIRSPSGLAWPKERATHGSANDILAHLNTWHEMFLLWEGEGARAET